MKFNETLSESFKKYNLRYKGTQPDYKIHDKNPFVLAIDDKYNPDDQGKSILGINLNYYTGNKNKLIKKINKNDNEAGFRGFEGKLKVRKFINKDIEEYEETQRKKRYDNFIKTFPHLEKYIRRYKYDGPKGTGIKSKKRKIL